MIRCLDKKSSLNLPSALLSLSSTLTFHPIRVSVSSRKLAESYAARTKLLVEKLGCVALNFLLLVPACYHFGATSWCTSRQPGLQVLDEAYEHRWNVRWEELSPSLSLGGEHLYCGIVCIVLDKVFTVVVPWAHERPEVYDKQGGYPCRPNGHSNAVISLEGEALVSLVLVSRVV